MITSQRRTRRLLLSVAAIAVLGAAGILLSACGRKEDSGDRAKDPIVRFELGPENCCNFKPVWSPDGSKIAMLHTFGSAYESAFMDEDAFPSANSPEIALTGPDGGVVTQITNDGRKRSGLDWSNDGAHLVYAYCQSATGKQMLAIANADGTHSRELEVSGYDPQWSPADSRIVFTYYTEVDPEDCGPSASEGGRIAVVEADDDGDVRDLASGKNPSWSRDGTKIAFVREDASDPTEATLYVMNSDGSGIHRITNGSYLRDPTWSPDGRTIAFSALMTLRGNYASGLFSVNVDGSGLRRLTTAEEDSGPDWSPDGRHLVFWTVRDFSDRDGTRGEIYLVNAENGSGLRALTSNEHKRK